MKVLMFGLGVISVLYGWALERVGHTVEFYVRRTAGPAVTLEVLDARGSIAGKRVNERWPVRLRETLPADRDYDLIIASVQHYHFEAAAAILGPRISRATVLVFNNFLDRAAAGRVVLSHLPTGMGLPGGGGGFGADGILRGALFKKVFFGTFLVDPGPRELAIRVFELTLDGRS